MSIYWYIMNIWLQTVKKILYMVYLLIILVYLYEINILIYHCIQIPLYLLISHIFLLFYTHKISISLLLIHLNFSALAEPLSLISNIFGNCCPHIKALCLILDVLQLPIHPTFISSYLSKSILFNSFLTFS